MTPPRYESAKTSAVSTRRLKLVRTAFYGLTQVGHYNIVDSRNNILAQLDLAIPARGWEPLSDIENRLLNHLELCWQLATDNTKTAMNIAAVTLDQVPGYETIAEPWLTQVETSNRTVDGHPIPYLYLAPGALRDSS